AAVSVDAKGTWKLQQKNPSPIPTRLKAVCGGHIAYCDVVQTGNTNVKQEKDKTKHKKDDKKKSSKRSDR
ncbi:MAG: hypothetical protein IH612_11285, partial [Desulfofustis sp.]|nr:hypothetical protein [Desulfofustis sp.]